MKITLQQTEKLLKGDYKFTQFGFSMLLTRLKSNYQKDSSQAALQKCTDEINAFLTKFKSIMESDFAIIAKL